MFLRDFVHVTGSRGILYTVGSTESNPEVLTRSDAQWWVHFALKCGMNIFVIDWFTNIHNGVRDDTDSFPRARLTFGRFSALAIPQAIAFSIASIGGVPFSALAGVLVGVFRTP
jgi:hypothetical protein